MQSTDIQFWDHSENIHKELLNFSKYCSKLLEKKQNDKLHIVDDFFDKVYVASLKMDGSNLAVQINKDKNNMCLIGRTQLIYTTDAEIDIVKIPKYGNAGSLGKLPLLMAEFALIMSEKMRCSNIIIYGEAFRYTGQQFASWHPFGCKIFDIVLNKWTTFLLNTNLHKMFTEASKLLNTDLIIPTTNNDVISTLLHSQQSLIFPPPILFVGTLSSVIDNLYDMIRGAVGKELEGCFAVGEDNYTGFKWKTPIHDAQKDIPAVTEFGFTKKNSVILYGKLVNVFALKKEHESVNLQKHKDALYRKKEADVLAETYATECSQTIVHVMSKHVSCANIKKEKRVVICEQIMKETIEEIIQIYEESGTTCPYSEEHMSKNTLSLVKQHIMKIPYDAD